MKYGMIIMGTLLFTACSQQPATTVSSPNDSVADTAAVSAQTTTQATGINAADEQSSARITSKGIISSEHDVPVFSRLSSVIQRLDIREGDKVTAGQTLVWLDDTQPSHNVKLYQSQLEQAQFQYRSILVGQGYDADHENAIPEHIRQAAKTRSSVDLYQVQLEDAKTLLSYCQVKAPISGLVTDLQVYRHDLAREGSPLFRIVDPGQLNIDFTILESELKHFQIGTTVKVTPIAYADKEYSATVVAISPKVDENGMVKIKAHIADPANLLVGMSALVSL